MRSTVPSSTRCASRLAVAELSVRRFTERGRPGARTRRPAVFISLPATAFVTPVARYRSEEHTSELQSRRDLVCRLLLEKKNKKSRHAAAGRHTRQRWHLRAR